MNIADEKIDLGGFAAIINSRLAADARIAKAMAFGWMGAGVAIAACLTGLGFASAFYGYSYMLSIRPAAEETAKALVQALERSELKARVSGTMSFDPNAELKLAPGQTIQVAPNAMVKLDPNSSVRVVGDLKVDMPQPSQRQLQVDATSRSEDLPFTSYTIFRSVGFGSGKVVTGWNYDLSDALRPKVQYCYYEQSMQRGLSVRYSVAINSSPLRPSPLSKVSFDFDGALGNCVWFSGA